MCCAAAVAAPVVPAVPAAPAVPVVPAVPAAPVLPVVAAPVASVVSAVDAEKAQVTVCFPTSSAKPAALLLHLLGLHSFPCPPLSNPCTPALLARTDAGACCESGPEIARSSERVQ